MMDQEKYKEDLLLKRTAEDTTEILLEFIVEKNQEAAPKKSSSRSRTKSVETAKALLLDSKRSAATQEVITETESEGFVVLSKTTCSRASSSCSSSCGVNTTSTKRPATLSLQTAADPEDPPLFSPCQSYPPQTTTGRMPLHAQSSPTLSSAKKVPNCADVTRSLSQMSTISCAESSHQLRARAIAECLRRIGDDIEHRHDKEKFEQDIASLVRLNPQQSVWQNVTRTFSSIYSILSMLIQQFGDSPPLYDESWKLLSEMLNVLREKLVPQISSLGGWGALLRDFDSPIVLGTTPWSHDHRSIGSPCLQRTLPVSHSTPCTNARQRQLLEYQPSPGSKRALRLNRSQTLPAVERHPRKLWRLSESGSLVDEDGNDDFCESLKREKEERKSEFESSGLSLDNAGQLADQYSDNESEKDDLVFSMEPSDTSLSSVIVASSHCQEESTREPLCDSGHVSSSETLSCSSTPSRDAVSFFLGGTPSRNDSAVDVRQPQNGEKRRPKSGCTFEKKNEAPAFDRARSRSMPISKRSRNTGSDTSRRSPVVLPSPQFTEGLYGNRSSISLSGISETVLYEAVRSLFT